MMTVIVISIMSTGIKVKELTKLRLMDVALKLIYKLATLNFS